MKVEQKIDMERIRDLLCCAFEGGSNYWYEITKIGWPPGLVSSDYTEGGKGQVGKSYWHWSQLVPTQEGGCLYVGDKHGDKVKGRRSHKLNLESIEKGMKVIAEKYPKHYGDFLAENEDADTGDVFLQCCLFGELVFG